MLCCYFPSRTLIPWCHLDMEVFCEILCESQRPVEGHIQGREQTWNKLKLPFFLLSSVILVITHIPRLSEPEISSPDCGCDYEPVFSWALTYFSLSRESCKSFPCLVSRETLRADPSPTLRRPPTSRFSLFKTLTVHPLSVPLPSRRCSAYQKLHQPSSPRSLYTPLSPCHHSYISCQVELASFSPSCCSTSKNKAPLSPSCQEAPVCSSAGLENFHFLTNADSAFQESEGKTWFVWVWTYERLWSAAFILLMYWTKYT